jgi:putative FmdB family regulatory protein
MPIYSYRCTVCDRECTAHVPYDQREQPQACYCGGLAEYHFSAPMIAGERIKGDKRLIWSEKQVESSHGPSWRDQGTTGRPGGAGSALIFDQGKV